MYVQKKSQCMCEAVLVLTIDSCSTVCFSPMHWPLSSPDCVRAMGSGYVLPLADGVSVNVCKSVNPAFPVIPFKVFILIYIYIIKTYLIKNRKRKINK